MSRRLALFLLLLLLLALAATFSGRIQSPFLSVLQSVNEAWNGFSTALSKRYEEHIDQQHTIEKLRAQIELYRVSHLVSHQMATEFNALVAENNASFRYAPNVELVRTIGYAVLGDMNKFWLDMPDFNRSRLYGLLYGEYAAGIVTARDGRPLALLNGDHQCTYAVYVGKNKAPGIIQGQNSDTMRVKYIPTWVPIAPGDEVVTSGLDRLFFSGIKVGKVLSVGLASGYRYAVVAPYYKGNAPDYFHVITQVR